MRSSNQYIYDIICGNQGHSLESWNSTAISGRWISQIRAAWSRTPSSIPSPIDLSSIRPYLTDGRWPACGKKIGKYVGRVACGSSGSFNISGSELVQGISHWYCEIVHRKDGYG